MANNWIARSKPALLEGLTMSFSTPILLIDRDARDHLWSGESSRHRTRRGESLLGWRPLASIWWIAMVLLRLNSEELSDKIHVQPARLVRHCCHTAVLVGRLS
jgi:hypothetical protein